MRALHWDGRELTFNSAYRAPTAGSRSALIQVHLAGICSTDLQIFKGYMSFKGVPGHEFVGSVSDGPGELIGKRVVGEINFGCGQCDVCRRDSSRHCPNRSVMGIVNADGAFAEWVSVPLENLHVVPDNVSDEEAVFTEPLVSDRLAETVAREAGVEVASLDPIEGLSEERLDAGDDYASVMRDNLAALRKALGCR